MHWVHEWHRQETNLIWESVAFATVHHIHLTRTNLNHPCWSMRWWCSSTVHCALPRKLGQSVITCAASMSNKITRLYLAPLVSTWPHWHDAPPEVHHWPHYLVQVTSLILRQHLTLSYEPAFHTFVLLNFFFYHLNIISIVKINYNKKMFNNTIKK